MTTDTLFNTREEWLSEAINECRAIFANENAGTIPDGVKVSCGFPLSAKRAKHTSIGECWAPAASAANVYEILISPTVSDAREVMAILVHELVHTLPGCMNHAAPFKRAAERAGLDAPTGKWGATRPGQTFDGLYGDTLAALGAYPHAALNVGERKKQGTRLLKAHCPDCGYTIRLTAKWAAQGLPTCVCGGDFTI